MNIPASFRTAIANTFYDKEVILYNKNTVVNDEGEVNQNVLSTSLEFLANVNFSKLDRIQEEYGLNSKVDVTMTTAQNIPEDSILGYQGKAYKAMRVIARDSHYFIIGKEWSSNSPTWVSA